MQFGSSSVAVGRNWFSRTISALALVVASVLTARELPAADTPLPPGIRILSESKTHVHANISDLPAKDFSALSGIQALYMVYFDGSGATDEKLEALAQLHLDNLVCVVFTDCPLITDKGIEYLARIPTLHSLGLRRMAITDAACDTMVTKMQLKEVNMPNCGNVTPEGLLKMVRSEMMESIGFSAGQMTTEDLIRIIKSASPRLKRVQIEITPSTEALLNLPALREAAADRNIDLYAVRNNMVKRL